MSESREGDENITEDDMVVDDELDEQEAEQEEQELGDTIDLEDEMVTTTRRSSRQVSAPARYRSP